MTFIRIKQTYCSRHLTISDYSPSAHETVFFLLASRPALLAGLVAVVLRGSSPFLAEGIKEKATTMTSTTVQTTVKPPIDLSTPEHTKTATFALSWFWGPDAQFGSIRGVIRTRVGYAGGNTKHSAYRSIGDHSKTVKIDYDPNRVSYEELLILFAR